MKTYFSLFLLAFMLFSQACLADEYADSLELAKLRIAEKERNPEYLEHIKKVQAPYLVKKLIESQNGNCVSGFEESGFELAIGILSKGAVKSLYR